MGKYVDVRAFYKNRLTNTASNTQKANEDTESTEKKDGIEYSAAGTLMSNRVDIMLNSRKKKEILSKVTIPQYFDKVIVPQLEPFGYYDVYPVDFNNKPVVCCPLHDEDTPSCRYYPDTETFSCFGCRKGGTVINLHKYFFERMFGAEVDDDTAIDYLYDVFINGDMTLKFPSSTTGETELTPEAAKAVEEAKVALFRFSAYRGNIENKILCDQSLSQETKQKIWEHMDKIDILIDKNIISVNDGIQSIKDKLAEIV